jgi:hypothetical protein
MQPTSIRTFGPDVRGFAMMEFRQFMEYGAYFGHAEYEELDSTRYRLGSRGCRRAYSQTRAIQLCWSQRKSFQLPNHGSAI